MTDKIRERLKNRGLRLARAIAAARLKRAGVVLGADWSRRPAPVETEPESTFSPETIRRLVGD
jgi:hypothetical protein